MNSLCLTKGGIYNLLRFNSHIFNIIFFAFLVITLFHGSTSSAQPVEIQLEKKLRKGHPRLMFTEADELRIKSLAKQDTLLQKLIENLFEQADQFLSEPVIEYKLVGPRPRLLTQSRICLSKILTLSTARLKSEQQIKSILISLKCYFI